MRVLFLIRREPGPTQVAIMAATRKQHEVTLRDLRDTSIDYGEVMARIEEHDRVITW